MTNSPEDFETEPRTSHLGKSAETTVSNLRHNEAPTPFQAWFNEKLKSTGYSIKAVSRHADMDYTHLWRIVKGKPSIYPNSRRPGYANTVAIGQLLGDLEGAMRAADYPMPEEMPNASTVVGANDPKFHDFTIGEFEGQPIEIIITKRLTQEELDQLRLAVQLIVKEKKPD